MAVRTAAALRREVEDGWLPSTQRFACDSCLVNLVSGRSIRQRPRADVAPPDSLVLPAVRFPTRRSPYFSVFRVPHHRPPLHSDTSVHRLAPWRWSIQDLTYYRLPSQELRHSERLLPNRRPRNRALPGLRYRGRMFGSAEDWGKLGQDLPPAAPPTGENGPGSCVSPTDTCPLKIASRSPVALSNVPPNGGHGIRTFATRRRWPPTRFLTRFTLRSFLSHVPPWLLPVDSILPSSRIGIEQYRARSYGSGCPCQAPLCLRGPGGPLKRAEGQLIAGPRKCAMRGFSVENHSGGRAGFLQCEFAVEFGRPAATRRGDEARRSGRF
jgi:hypothetical protein